MRTPYDASVEHVADLDQTERDARATAASTLLGPLAERGVVGVATTFVDNSGVARVKAVPLGRLPHLAAWGVGSASTTGSQARAPDARPSATCA